MMKMLTARYGLAEANLRWEQIVRQDQAWIQENGDLGGSKNMMASNLMLFYAVCAFYEALDKNLTAEQFKAFANEVMAPTFKLMNLFDMNRFLKHKHLVKLVYRMIDSYKKQVDKKRGKEWGNTWLLTVNPKERTYGIAYTLHTCPLYDFARDYGYTEVLPYLCAMDHEVADAVHAKLIRHQVLSAGDPECQYWYVGDKSPEGLADTGSK